MASVYNLCVLLIRKGKSREEVLDKMDVYLAADRLTAFEYNQLLQELGN